MIDIVQLDRGGEVAPSELAGITVTTIGTSQRSYGHNAMILYLTVTGTGTWTITVQGKVPFTINTYVDAYDNNGNLLAISSAIAGKCKLMVGLPHDFKIVATEVDGTATVSIAYELLSV